MAPGDPLPHRDLTREACSLRALGDRYVAMAFDQPDDLSTRGFARLARSAYAAADYRAWLAPRLPR